MKWNFQTVEQIKISASGLVKRLLYYCIPATDWQFKYTQVQSAVQTDLPTGVSEHGVEDIWT